MRCFHSVDGWVKPLSTQCSDANLQVVVVPVGMDLVPSVHIEHRVQTLGGAGVLFKLLHLHRDKQ